MGLVPPVRPSELAFVRADAGEMSKARAATSMPINLTHGRPRKLLTIRGVIRL